MNRALVVACVAIAAIGAFSAARAQDAAPTERWEHCTIVSTLTGMQTTPRITTTCPGVDVGKGYPLDAMNAAGGQGWHMVATESSAATGQSMSVYWMVRTR